MTIKTIQNQDQGQQVILYGKTAAGTYIEVQVNSSGQLINQLFSSYEIVGASATAQVLGAAGAVGDLLHLVMISVNTSLTGTCSIDDGAGTNIPLTAANTPIGVYPVLLDAISVTGAWRVTTGAGVTAIAVGRFT